MASTSSTRYCGKCGNKYEVGKQKFCGFCGSEVELTDKELKEKSSSLADTNAKQVEMENRSKVPVASSSDILYYSVTTKFKRPQFGILQFLSFQF